MVKARSRQIGVCVEVAPLGSVADVLREEPLDWINISGWVRLDQGITVSRGVGSDGHTPDTGTLSVTLDNDTGGWTPGRDFTTLLESVVGESEWAATFEGNLRDETSIKGLPIRVRHLGNVPTYAETQALYVDYAAWMAAEETYADTINPDVLWTGVISTVRQVWAGGFAPQVKVAAADPVAVLERQPMRSLPVTAVTHAAAAAWCYPLSEDAAPLSSVTATADVAPLGLIAVGFPLEGNALTFDSGTSPGSEPGGKEYGCPTWGGGTETTGWALDTGNVAGGTLPKLTSYDSSFTLHAMVLPEGSGRVRYALSAAGVNNMIVSIGVDETNFPRVLITLASGAWFLVEAPEAVTPGQWHHIGARFTDEDLITTLVELWVDGVMVADDSINATLYAVGDRRIVAGARIQPRGELADVWVGDIANIAGHAGPVSDLALQRIAAGRAGWTGDDTCGRFNRILWALGYDRSALPEGSSTMCPQHADGKYLADVLDDCAVAERAPWWCTRDGVPTMRNRSARWSAVTTTTIPAEALGQQLEFTLDDAARRTVAAVSRPGGQAIVRRSPLADIDGEIGTPVTLRVDSDAQVEALADEMVSDAHAQAQIATPSIAVDVVRSGRVLDIPDVLAVDVEHVIEVTDLPGTAPWASRRLLVRRCEDKITATSWVRTFDVVVAPELIDVFRLDDDLLDGDAVLGW